MRACPASTRGADHRSTFSGDGVGVSGGVQICERLREDCQRRGVPDGPDAAHSTKSRRVSNLRCCIAASTDVASQPCDHVACVSCPHFGHPSGMVAHRHGLGISSVCQHGRISGAGPGSVCDRHSGPSQVGRVHGGVAGDSPRCDLQGASRFLSGSDPRGRLPPMNCARHRHRHRGASRRVL